MTLYFAFQPPDEPLNNPTDDMGFPDGPMVSIYDDESDKPYDVTGATAKIEAAIIALPKTPCAYEPHNGWVRVEFSPLVWDGEIKRHFEP